MTPDLLTYTEAAAALSVSRRTLFRMIAAHHLTPVQMPRPSRLGTVPRISRAQVEAITGTERAS